MSDLILVSQYLRVPSQKCKTKDDLQNSMNSETLSVKPSEIYPAPVFSPQSKNNICIVNFHYLPGLLDFIKHKKQFRKSD